MSLSVFRLLPFEKVHFPLLHAKVLGANVGLYPMLGLDRRDLFVALFMAMFAGGGSGGSGGEL